MFFTGNLQHNGRRAFRRQHRAQEQQQPRSKYAMLIQLLPFLLVMLFSVLPQYFQSKPYFKFEQDETYHTKLTTSINKANYYVGDRFIDLNYDLNMIRSVFNYIYILYYS